MYICIEAKIVAKWFVYSALTYKQIHVGVVAFEGICTRQFAHILQRECKEEP